MNESEIKTIQEDCRRSYRAEDNLINPYEFGSVQWAAWDIEVKKIINEERASV